MPYHGWFKAKASGGWLKASASGGGACCVEVNLLGHEVLVRDTKYSGDPSVQPMLRVSRSEWQAFLAKTRQAPIHYQGTSLMVETRVDGWTVFRSGAVRLHFRRDEMAAFLDGVEHHEFDVVPALA